MIKHIINVAKSLIRESSKRNEGGGRSSKWPAVEKQHKKENPTCAACGSKEKIQVHHIKPFHLHPELELEPSNLISLCMADDECHLLIGHGDDFKAYNPNVVEDSAKYYLHSEMRTLIVENAKKNRVML